jgi:erythromycin esterase-like protein
MYVGGAKSWNLRDTHMFETFEALLAFHGPRSKAVVWAHNSHLGDASATAMARRGELNLGQLVRERFADDAYLVGFGTDHGTVAAATDWDGPMEIKRVRPSHPDSYERLCHETSLSAFLLPVGQASGDAPLRDELLDQRLERAIGVIYRPETELMSHYFEARLPEQFDEWIWFDETSAVTPLAGPGTAPSLEEGHPFATFDR